LVVNSHSSIPQSCQTHVPLGQPDGVRCVPMARWFGPILMVSLRLFACNPDDTTRWYVHGTGKRTYSGLWLSKLSRVDLQAKTIAYSAPYSAAKSRQHGLSSSDTLGQSVALPLTSSTCPCLSLLAQDLTMFTVYHLLYWDARFVARRH
jgi:hypothetical protein